MTEARNGSGACAADAAAAAAARSRNAVVAAVSLLVWGAVSGTLIMLNKRLYAAGFEFPMILTGVGQVCWVCERVRRCV
jgi:hypothetical protein